jgi:dihydropteroate synthase
LTGQNIPAERLAGSLAAGLVGVANGAAILRVHDVAPHWQALQVLHAIGGSSQMREAQ